jgi:hypothetical protein
VYKGEAAPGGASMSSEVMWMGSRRRRVLVSAACLAVVISGATGSADARRGGGSATAESGKTAAVEHISLTPAGGQFSGFVLDSSPIDRSERFVVFTAKVKRRIGGSFRLVSNVFIRDRMLNTTRLVSVGRGHPANGDSYTPEVSSDGHIVAFTSEASNLVRRDTNGRADVFVRNLRTNTTRRVSVPAAGVGERQANAESFGPLLSAHGGLVVFTSVATNLVGHDTNRASDVFVRDRRRRVTRRLSVGRHRREANGSSSAADLSADGKELVYVSDANNLGPRDVNGRFDIYARRIRRPGNELVSRSPSGGQFVNCRDAAISARGRFVTIQCGPSGGPGGSFEAVFRRDRLRGLTVPVSTDANGHVARGAISGVATSSDGRFVAFSTTATVLSPSTDLVAYVKDMRTGVTIAASVDSTGQPVEGWLPELSDEGQLITFRTPAQLLPTDHNHIYDVYLRRWAAVP